jgi:hypothetical protein
MSQATPSIGRIILSDYGCFLSVAIPTALYGLVFFGSVLGFVPDLRPMAQGDRRIDDVTFFVSLAAVALVVSAPVLFVRSRVIREAFASGRAASGVIDSLRFVKDRGRVEYRYEQNGQAYRSGNAIMKNRRTRSLARGQTVTVYVHPSNPERAYLEEIYLA